MNTEDLADHIETTFAFLTSEYGMRLERKITASRDLRFVYLGSEAGVIVTLDYRILFIRIMLCRLKRGQLVENPERIGPDTELNCFDLGELIDPETRLCPLYEYDSTSEYKDVDTGLSTYFSAFARDLRKYGHKFLVGDFSELASATAGIRNRAAEFKLQRSRD